MGVNVFFVTSGYLIFQSWQRDPSIPRYLARRTLRIFPALLAAVLVTVFIIGPAMSSLPVGTYLQRRETYRYLGNIAFIGSKTLPGVFESNPYPDTVNGGLWTLKYEFAMYLILLGIGVLGRKAKWVLPCGLVLVALCSAVLASCLRLAQFGLDAAIPFATHVAETVESRFSSTSLRFPELALYFMIGALFSHWRERVSFRWDVFLGMMLAWYFVSDQVGSFALAWLIVSYGALCFGTSNVSGLSRFGRRGDFSYGIYIYGFVVQQCVSKLLGPAPSWGIALMLSFAVTLVMGVLSWRFIEAPAMRFKDDLCARLPGGLKWT